MKKTTLIFSLICSIALSFTLIVFAGTSRAEKVIRYSCSSQIYEALEKQRIDAFSKKTGIKIDVYDCASDRAVSLLMNDMSDVAATARRLYPGHRDYGYWETIFAKDPLAIIVSMQNPISNITEEALKEVFSGRITNWKDLGGPDKPIFVIVPGKNTAAYSNFSRRPMGRELIKYDLMGYKSTTVIEVVRHFPWSISFISAGAAHREGLKSLKVDGMGPADTDYRYCQVYSFVTKGKPSGSVKEFIDHLMSEEGKTIMKKIGIVPSFEACE